MCLVFSPFGYTLIGQGSVFQQHEGILWKVQIVAPTKQSFRKLPKIGPSSSKRPPPPHSPTFVHSPLHTYQCDVVHPPPSCIHTLTHPHEFVSTPSTCTHTLSSTYVYAQILPSLTTLPLLMHCLSPLPLLYSHILFPSTSPHTLGPSFPPVYKMVTVYDRSSFSTMKVNHKLNQVSACSA